MTMAKTSSSSLPARQATFNWPRLLTWGGFALVLLLAPQVFGSSLAVSMLSQMGIAIIACLSYNMLLGHGGMLSFGHAVYSGLGSYFAIHALVRMGEGGLSWLPVSLLPIVGGLAGLFFAALFGWVSTRRAGTTFAMITLGMGELVFAMSLMFSEFFGGEAGISADRVVGDPVMGISFGPTIQVYYLIAIYTFVCVALMFAFTRTPLGRILNAVRDNPERVEFIGYNTQWVRYLAFMISGFFAGVAGGLGAILFEIVTAEVVNAHRSGAYLLFTFLGGATVFFGPIIGGVLMVLAIVWMSELTQAWLLYLGLVFLLMVMYAPGGLAAIVMHNMRVASHGMIKVLLPNYLMLGAALLVLLAGSGALIEMIYHLQLNAAMSDTLRFAGLTLNVRSHAHWLGAAAVALAGLGLLHVARQRFMQVWGMVQSLIDKKTLEAQAS